MSALGRRQTCAPQKAMSVLRRIATAKADSRKRYVCFTPRKRTCAAQTRCQLRANSGQKRTRAARPKVSSYPFFADREGKNLFAPTWLEVEHPMRIRNNGRQGRDRSRRPVGKRGGHRALIGSASSVQTHRKSGARFGGANRDSSPFWR